MSDLAITASHRATKCCRSAVRCARLSTRATSTAILEACCRPGEILSLQRQDVDLTLASSRSVRRRPRRAAAASRAGESTVRESCKFLQTDSGFAAARRRRRSVVHGEQVTAFLATWVGLPSRSSEFARKAVRLRLAVHSSAKLRRDRLRVTRPSLAS